MFLNPSNRLQNNPIERVCWKIVCATLVVGMQSLGPWETFLGLDKPKQAHNELQRSQAVVFSLTALVQLWAPGLVHNAYEMYI
jgi:hypothetical protein